MKIEEWHQWGRSEDFIVKLKKKYILSTILRLDKWIPNRRLLFKNFFPKHVIQKNLNKEPYWTSMDLGTGLLQTFGKCNWKYYLRVLSPVK